ncbi:MAG: hypothetical protein QM689_10145 [Oscillospiraceae bacterium]
MKTVYEQHSGEKFNAPLSAVGKGAVKAFGFGNLIVCIHYSTYSQAYLM